MGRLTNEQQSYTREDAAGKFLILLYFSTKNATFNNNHMKGQGKVALANYTDVGKTITLQPKISLRPYEAMVIEL
jgi:oligo-1,6-glucosidase